MITLFNLFSPAPVYAQTVWTGKCVSNNIATIHGFECLFRNILQVIVRLAGLVFFAMFLVGGFKYLTSGGDPKKAAAATSTLTSALFGIIGVIVSWFILLFIEKFTGIKVTQFTIPYFN